MVYLRTFRLKEKDDDKMKLAFNLNLSTSQLFNGTDSNK